MPEPNTFAGAVLDRAGAHRRDAAWLAARRADPASRAVVAAGDGVYLTEADPPRPALVPLTGLERPEGADEPLLLGLDDLGAVFAVDADADSVAPERIAALAGSVALTGLRDAGGRVSQQDGGLLAYTVALVNWHRRHRFCGVCGHATGVREAGLVRVCPACGAQHHPRTDPVVIMLVHDGDRVLLGRQAAWPAGRYSALAGFVSPGESLEEAVARETLEEVGVDVDELRYVSSQPWPFPISLMLGFTARYTGGEVVAREGELEDARWFTRADTEAATTGDGPFAVPPPLAIARRLIDGWLGVN